MNCAENCRGFSTKHAKKCIGTFFEGERAGQSIGGKWKDSCQKYKVKKRSRLLSPAPS